MVRLSRETELRDALNVLAANRRELVLAVDTDRPLRKPRGRLQARAMRARRAEVSEQILSQLDEQARRAFRGRVALELRLALPTDRFAASLAPVVKDYLDVLRGPVIRDDALIDHLLVQRRESEDGHAHVVLRCLPLSIFIAEFDRAFRVMRELGPLPGRRSGATDGAQTWGLRAFDEYDRKILAYEEQTLDLIERLNEEEDDQLAQDPDALVDLDVPSTTPELHDRDARESVREHLIQVTASARGRWLADQGIDARDRPGSAPEWIAETVELNAADIVSLSDRGPGVFVLPAPPTSRTRDGQTTWDRALERAFATRRGKDRWWRARFDGPLTLDVARRGRAGHDADLDNVAHRVLASFCAAFAAARPSVSGYRVYRQHADADDLRVRLLPASRMAVLAQAMDRARELIGSHRSERGRPL